MHLIDLCGKIEQILRKGVRGKYPLSWDEDHITYSIFEELRNTFRYVEANDDSFENMKILWTGYKQKGTREKAFGDIALYIKIAYEDGDKLEGVAFLEAKKRYENKRTFNAIKRKQLKEIYKHAPHSMILLYDYEEIKRKSFWWAILPVSTHTAIVPLNVVLTIRKKDMTLYKFSSPLSYQLCFRYFRGRDLEFSKEAIQTAQGFMQKWGIPKCLITISIAYGRAEIDREFEINREMYLPIGNNLR